jgi:hypothetical protein
MLIEGKRVAVLMENKVDAGFQDSQPERYLQRKAEVIAEGAQEAYACIIGPEEYISKSSKSNLFDFCITYEVVRDYYLRAGDKRSEFKRMLLDAAIEKLRRGYQRQDDPVVSGFWHNYWKLLVIEHPNAWMNEPDGSAKDNDWLEFRLDWMPKRCKIIHKLSGARKTGNRIGYLDLETGINDKDVLARLIEGNADFYIHQARKTCFIRRNVPLINRFEDFSAQIDKLRECFGAAMSFDKLREGLESSFRQVKH